MSVSWLWSFKTIVFQDIIIGEKLDDSRKWKLVYVDRKQVAGSWLQGVLGVVDNVHFLNCDDLTDVGLCQIFQTVHSKNMQLI
jgi:hypothetical protein